MKEEKTRTTIYMSKDLIKRAKQEALNQDTFVSDIYQIALTSYFNAIDSEG